MKIPFQLPVRIESKKFLVAADSELISHLPDATCEEAEAIPRLINAAKIRGDLLQEFVNLCKVGDVDETTQVHGWGDLIRRTKEALK